MTGIGAALRAGLSIAWRHRWVFGVPIVTALLPAALHVVHLPDVYKATGTVGVRATSSARVAAGATQETRPEQLLATARDRLLATRNVEAIVPLLYPDAPRGSAAHVAKARARVSYDQIGEATGFSASVEDRSPARAAAAVNRLLDAFVETERELQLEVARVAFAFSERQLGEATADFDAARARLEAFGAEHRGVMPQDREAVAAELSRVDAEVRDLEARAASSRRLMNEYELLLRRPAASAAPPTPGLQMSAEELRLQTALVAQQQALDKAKSALADLRTRYQDRWPAVVAARAEVDTLGATLAETTRRLEEAHRLAERDASSRRTTENQGAVELYAKARAEEADAERRHLADAERRRQDREALRLRLAEIPTTERALVTVRQTLDSTQLRLVARDQSLQAARQQVDALASPDLAPSLLGFRIETAARPPSPDNPSGPPRARWLALAVAAGVAFGALLVWLRDRFDEGVIDTPAQLVEILPRALIVAVPLYGEGRAAPTRRSVAGVDWVCGAWVLLLGAATVLVVSWHAGWLETPGWFRPWLGSATS